MSDKNLHIDNFLGHFREKLDNYSPEVPENEILQMWDSVSNQISVNPATSSSPFSKHLNIKSLGIISAGITITVTALLIISNIDKNNGINNSTQNNDEIVVHTDSFSSQNSDENKKADEIEKKADVLTIPEFKTDNSQTGRNEFENNSISDQSSVLDYTKNTTTQSSFPEVIFSDTILCEGDNLRISFNPVSKFDDIDITLILPDQQINSFRGVKNYRFDKPGTYYIYIICSMDNQIIKKIQKIYIQPKPFAQFGFDNTNEREVKFSNLTTNADHYLWDFGDGTSSALTHPRHIYQYGGTFTVRLVAENKFGCKSEITKDILVRANSVLKEPYIPNYFSPDGDGVDDYYYITIEGETFFELEITDRYGNKVFSSKSKDKKWDGTNEVTGKICDEGQYFYFLQYKTAEANSIEKKSGTIYLKRIK